MRQIVCAVTGTDTDRHAIAVADSFARGLGLHLVVVHVRGRRAAPAAAPAPGKLMDAAQLTRGHAIDLVGLAREAGVQEPDCLVLDGDHEELLERICLLPTTAWLVVGDPGEGPLLAALRGTASRRLLRARACPVAIVPEGLPAPPVPPVTVAGLVDAAGDADADAGQPARTAGFLAEALGGEAVLVRAGEADRPQRTDALLEAAREEGAEVLVCGTPEHGGAYAALMGSSTERLLRDLREVLVVVGSGPED